jgi:hypothetical protein
VPGLEDAAVNTAAEMLDESSEQPAVGAPDGEVAIQKNPCGTHAARSVGSEGKARAD